MDVATVNRPRRKRWESGYVPKKGDFLVLTFDPQFAQ